MLGDLSETARQNGRLEIVEHATAENQVEFSLDTEIIHGSEVDIPPFAPPADGIFARINSSVAKSWPKRLEVRLPIAFTAAHVQN